MNSRIRRAAAIARDMYGVRGEVRPLPGEFDLNFRVTSPSADIVLKLSPESRLPVFDLVTACLYHLAAAKFPGSVPRLVAPSATGADASVSHVTFEGAPYVACAVTWLRGVPLAELRPRSPAVLEALGALLAELDAALADFDHPALDRDFAWRMESAPATIRAHLRHLDRGGDLVAATLDRATARLDPVVDGLPGAVIHNDGNDFNVLVRPSLGGAPMVGLIDFGDVVRSWRAAEVAVAAAYAMMEMADPLDAGCAIARGYASVTPLTAGECRAILPMVALRLCLSVSVQARQMREQPDNEYLAVSQAAAWRLLGVLARTDWRLAEFRIREACGLVPNPALAAVPPIRVRPTPGSSARSRPPTPPPPSGVTAKPASSTTPPPSRHAATTAPSPAPSTSASTSSPPPAPPSTPPSPPASGSGPAKSSAGSATPRPTVAGPRTSTSRSWPWTPSMTTARPRGVGAWLYDDTGRRYLDTVNNVPHVGHGNPRVAEAIARQSRVLNTNTRYLHTEIPALAEELLAHFPAPLEVVFLVCSGSEANELALRMARCHTGNDGVVCLEGGYHGTTGGLVEISHYKFAGPGGAGPSDRVVAAAIPDTYRGRWPRVIRWWGMCGSNRRWCSAKTTRPCSSRRSTRFWGRARFAFSGQSGPTCFRTRPGVVQSREGHEKMTTTPYIM